MIAFRGDVTAVLLLLVASALADERPSYAARSHRPSEDSFEEEAKYSFDWHVDEDDNNFNQVEQRDGDNTRGSYVVDLPDGRRQIVTYYVSGDSGYVAEVKYEGEARYPEHESVEVRGAGRAYN